MDEDEEEFEYASKGQGRWKIDLDGFFCLERQGLICLDKEREGGRNKNGGMENE